MPANRERGEHGTENAGSCSGPNGDPTFHEAALVRGLSPDEETAQWLGEAIADDVETYEVDGNRVTFTRDGRTYVAVLAHNGDQI